MFLDTVSRSKGIQLLKLGWTPPAIAIELHCHPATVYRWERRLQMHGYLMVPGLAGLASNHMRPRYWLGALAGFVGWLN